MNLTFTLSKGSYKMPFKELQQYLNKESLKRLPVVDGEVTIILEHAMNISIAEGEAPSDKFQLATKGGVEARDARSR